MIPMARGTFIAPYVWCVIGAILGFLASLSGGEGTIVMRIESVLVGVFGAFLGGEFIAVYLLSPAMQKSINAATVGMAIGGAVVALGLLMAMRKAVGPMKAGKSKRRHD